MNFIVSEDRLFTRMGAEWRVHSNSKPIQGQCLFLFSPTSTRIGATLVGWVEVEGTAGYDRPLSDWKPKLVRTENPSTGCAIGIVMSRFVWRLAIPTWSPPPAGSACAGAGGCQKVSGSHNVVETLILVLLVQCLRCVSGECFRHPCQPNKAETRPCELPKSFERLLWYWTIQPKICVQFEVCQMTKTTSKS